MWSSILASVFKLLEYFLGWKMKQADHANSPEVKAAYERATDVTRQDVIEDKVEKAAQGDPASLEELRRMSAE